jgi:hypothetical protein
MSTYDETKHPRGKNPANVGQYSPKDHAEPAGVELGTPHTDWGNVGLQVGSRTPWGEADQVEDIAPGIVRVYTDSHGGYKLSAQRNRRVPAPFREKGGWYEEDDGWAGAAYAFPDEIGNIDLAERLLREYQPDAWEQVTGERVTPEESNVVAAREFNAAHADDWIVNAASRGDDGMTTVWARKGGQGETREFTMPSEDYKPGTGAHAFAFPDGAYADVTPPPAPPAPRYHDAGIDLEALTPAVRKTVEKDLAQQWRREDGRVRTLAQIIAEEGISDKKVRVSDGGRTEYALVQREREGDSTYISLSVSKATWKAATGIPDSMSEKDYARLDVIRARVAHDKVDKAMRAMRNFRKADELRRGEWAATGHALEEARARLDHMEHLPAGQ